MPRRNYLFGKLTRGAGYWPDYQMRLIKRGHARYDRPASEIVVLDGPAGDLQQPLIHYNYETIAQFRAKQTFRIDFEATNLYRRGEKCKFYSPYYMTIRHFWWRYVTLKGYRDGLHGLRLCLLLAYYFGFRYYQRLGQLYRSGRLQKNASHIDSPCSAWYTLARIRASASLRGHHENGGMAEWLKAAVLKTAVALVVTGGSNPSPSALRCISVSFGEVPEWPNGAAC